MNKYIFYLAVTGWTLGLIVHFTSVFGIDVTEQVPYVWFLHLGIFVVWIPTILYLNKNEELKTFKESGMLNQMNPFGFYKIVFKQTPNWLAVIAVGGIFYAFANFMLFMGSEIGTPDIEGKKYILHNHGQLIKTITEHEYHHYKANEVRGFSGYWIAFYGLAMAILYPFSRPQVVVNKN
jgi:hypothetical protein